MGKVLILQEEITRYRLPIFNLLAQKVDLTIGCLREPVWNDDVSFKYILLKSKQYKGVYYISNLLNCCNNFDVVFYMPHFRIVGYFMLPFFRQKFKTIAWTNGTRASYTQKFDLDRKMGLLDKIYFKNLRKADAVVLYIEEALKTVTRYGVKRERVFFAYNTVAVDYRGEATQMKNSIMFIGTLYKGKGVEELIRCYGKAYLRIKNKESFPTLDIVGTGTELLFLQQLVKELHLEQKIIFYGAIYDESVLSKMFQKAILCVSPNQAGLSVLKSLGYGVPFVTKVNAITGGEIVNVIDGYNGLLLKDTEDFVELFTKVETEKNKFIVMGDNARRFYETKVSPEIMVKGFVDAINYVMK